MWNNYIVRTNVSSMLSVLEFQFQAMTTPFFGYNCEIYNETSPARYSTHDSDSRPSIDTRPCFQCCLCYERMSGFPHFKSFVSGFSQHKCSMSGFHKSQHRQHLEFLSNPEVKVTKLLRQTVQCNTK